MTSGVCRESPSLPGWKGDPIHWAACSGLLMVGSHWTPPKRQGLGTGLVKGQAWIGSRSVSAAPFPGRFRSSMQSSFTEGQFGGRVAYLEVKRSVVLGLSPNGDGGPRDEQKQQPHHCRTSGVPRRQQARPLGQNQTQARQQQSYKVRVEETSPARGRVCQTLDVSFPKTATPGGLWPLQGDSAAKDPVDTRIATREKSHHSPSSEAHP